MNNPRQRLKTSIILSVVTLMTVLVLLGTVFTTSAIAQNTREEAVAPAAANPGMNIGLKFGLIAAAIAFGLGALSSGYAISHVGAAAMGAVAEKPQIAGQALIFVALAEGIVVFGFITALMILGKV